MASKRYLAVEEEVELEVVRLCGQTRCDVCVVPLASQESAIKHYEGKIHARKLARWRDGKVAQKRLKLELSEGEYFVEGEEGVVDNVDRADIRQGPNWVGEIDQKGKTEDVVQSRSGSLEDNADNSSSYQGNQGVKVNNEKDLRLKEKEVKTEETALLSAGPLDPRDIDNMDPATMRKILKGSRWDAPDEDPEEEAEDDPEDMSIPVEFSKLMSRCYNPTTDVGYCQVCNKLLQSQQGQTSRAKSHWSGKKHAAKLEIYQDQLLSEAAILAGTAVPNPPPHRGFYCELCESDCSSKVQFDQHLRGERHRTNVRRMERELAGDPELDKDINPYNLPEGWLRERKHCNLCDVPIFSVRIAKIHFNSRLHRDAAGLNILPSHQEEASLVPVGGNLPCDICNIKVVTELDMKVHCAGIRHLENERTKSAVEGHGGDWRVVLPVPPDLPKHSVKWQPPQQGGPGGFGPMGCGWGGGPMMRGWGPPMMGMNTSMGPGQMMGPRPMNGPGHRMQGQGSMNGPGQRMPGQGGPMNGSSPMMHNLNPMGVIDPGMHMRNSGSTPGHMMQGQGPQSSPTMSSFHPAPTPPPLLNLDVGRPSESLKECQVQSDTEEQHIRHLASEQHLGAEASLQGEEEEEEVQAEPLQENPTKTRSKKNPFHCPLCEVWVPTVTLLKFYHSEKDEHKEKFEAISGREKAGAELVFCKFCKISAANVTELVGSCLAKQKLNVYGAHRSYSCDACDIHLSEKDWLDNHNKGEKHKWMVERVEKGLPVQWELPEMEVVQKTDYNPYTGFPVFYPEFLCHICKVGFSPIEKYRKHLGSLFHLRKCAGEEVSWVEGGNSGNY